MADDTKVNEGHATSIADEGKLVNASSPDPIAEARRLHHLATADPEPERPDGLLTGTAHEEKYQFGGGEVLDAFGKILGPAIGKRGVKFEAEAQLELATGLLNHLQRLGRLVPV